MATRKVKQEDGRSKTLLTICTGIVAAAATVIGGTWFLASEMNKRPTLDQMQSTVSLCLDSKLKDNQIEQVKVYSRLDKNLSMLQGKINEIAAQLEIDPIELAKIKDALEQSQYGLDDSNEPRLAISQAAIDFGPTEETRTIRLSNTGTGCLQFEVVPAVNWVEAVPERGSFATESFTVEFKIDRGKIDRYSTGLIKLNSNGGDRFLLVAGNIRSPIRETWFLVLPLVVSCCVMFIYALLRICRVKIRWANRGSGTN